MYFSVIVPVYNVRNYLEMCVDSILQQTFLDYEVILVDDGSTDGSSEICDIWKEDKRFKVLHKQNGGLSSARNAGTEIAQGEYIIYIDSDDFIISNDFFSTIFKQSQDSTDLIFYKYIKYDDSSQTAGKCAFSFQGILDEDAYAEKIYKMVCTDSFYGMAWIKAIKRSVLVDSAISFEEGLLGEDMDWNYQVLRAAETLKVIDKEFIAYRQRKNSISSSLKIKNLTDYIYILEKWGIDIDKNISSNLLRRALLGSLAKYYSNLFIVYERVEDTEKKQYVHRIKELAWLFQYSLSKRPKALGLAYRIFGFNITIKLLKIVDRG